ncbi:MAG: ThuA domain-containing protein, partial [Planctomycetota bacterium]
MTLGLSTLIRFRISTLRRFVVLASLFLTAVILLPNDLARAQPSPAKPIKVLVITGGCCHDYTTQKNLIKEGLESRANFQVTVVQQGGSGTYAKIKLYEDPNWADDYDVVIHDECFADVKDTAWIQRILKPHQEGKPAVVIHCAMHCYRDGTDNWFKFCGVTSRGHGAHYAHEVLNRDGEHPIMKGWGAAWANPA